VIVRFEKVDKVVIKELEGTLNRLNIPLDAVVVKKQPKPIPASRESYIRPLIGGIKIVQPPSHGKCTLGFVAKRNGVRGFVTAAHCVDKYGDVYQPTEDPYYRVGTVVIKSSSRNSDSAWVRIEGVSSDFRIYNQYNTANHYSVFSKMYSQTEGMRVCKGGITTGETCGVIVDADYDNLPVPIYGWLDNQIEATFRSSQGDSGAAVYYSPLDSWVVNWCISTYGVTCKDIYGVVNSYLSAYPYYSYYSPIGNVEADLGYLDVNG
jgi:hypothetical protein